MTPNIATLPDCNVLESNIETMLLRDARLARDAARWYALVRRFVARLARVTGRDAHIIASALAALSPDVEWHENARMTVALLRDAERLTFRNTFGKRDCGLLGYGANIVKARAILRENDADYCRGPKVSAFRDACCPHCPSDGIAVVDVHATNIAMGTDGVYSGPGASLPIIASAYATVAMRHGLSAHAVQSATWVIYKGTKSKRRPCGLARCKAALS